jgi:hypothetical protein
MQFFKIFIAFILGLVIGALTTNYLLGSEQPEESKNTGSNNELSIVTDKIDPDRGDNLNNFLGTNASFEVSNQLAGNNVTVTNVKMPQSGWVVVHEVLDGFVANALGATRIDEGDYDVVTVELLRPSVPQSDYVVTLYADDGNKHFDINADTPMFDIDGNAIFKEFETASGSAS